MAPHSLGGLIAGGFRGNKDGVGLRELGGILADRGFGRDASQGGAVEGRQHHLIKVPYLPHNEDHIIFLQGIRLAGRDELGELISGVRREGGISPTRAGGVSARE